MTCRSLTKHQSDEASSPQPRLFMKHAFEGIMDRWTSRNVLVGNHLWPRRNDDGKYKLILGKTIQVINLCSKIPLKHLFTQLRPCYHSLIKSYTSSHLILETSPSLMTVFLVRTDERSSKWHSKQLRIIEVTLVVRLIHALHTPSRSNMWAMELYPRQELELLILLF